LTLIKSISGIRGTIGGEIGKGFTPIDIVKFSSAFGTWLLKETDNNQVVIGRDARISGEMVTNLVIGTLQGVGINVIDLGLSTTPTVSLAVPDQKAGGGIMITASHNPIEWNALKLFNKEGELVSADDGNEILAMAENFSGEYAKVKNLGSYKQNDSSVEKHIVKILKLPLVDVDAIKSKDFRIVVDCVNSTGGISVPRLLKALGVGEVIELFCDPNGKFPHNPEPLPENLNGIANEVKFRKADLGIVVDPDVDRLALVCEDGSMFGEEYTLVAVADYILQESKGNTVSNLSSSMALRDVTEQNDGVYHASAVGEVNVVQKMKEVKAVIGGEGNGGIIYPDLHYSRDALVGIALFLSHLAKTELKTTGLRRQFPDYFIAKNKMELSDDVNLDDIFDKVLEKYSDQPISNEDGLRIEFNNEWVHLRRSNTEAIIRIYSESKDEQTAQELGKKIMEDIRQFMK